MNSFLICNVISWNVFQKLLSCLHNQFSCMYHMWTLIPIYVHLKHGILTQGIMWSRECLSTAAGHRIMVCQHNMWTCLTMALQLFTLTILKKTCNVYKLLVYYSTTDTYLRYPNLHRHLSLLPECPNSGKFCVYIGCWNK